MNYNEWDRPLTIIIVIGIVVLAFILIFNYYNYNNSNNSNYVVNNYTNDSGVLRDLSDLSKISNISAIKINMSNLTAEDKQFMAMIKESDMVIQKDIKSAMDASNNNDSTAFQNSGKSLQQDSTIYLNISNNIKVSPQFKIISDEHKRALQKFYNGGKYMQSGTVNPRDLNLSIDSINAGLVYVDNINTILKNSNNSMVRNNLNNK